MTTNIQDLNRRIQGYWHVGGLVLKGSAQRGMILAWQGRGLNLIAAKSSGLWESTVR